MHKETYPSLHALAKPDPSPKEHRLLTGSGEPLNLINSSPDSFHRYINRSAISSAPLPTYLPSQVRCIVHNVEEDVPDAVSHPPACGPSSIPNTPHTASSCPSNTISHSHSGRPSPSPSPLPLSCNFLDLDHILAVLSQDPLINFRRLVE